MIRSSEALEVLGYYSRKDLQAQFNIVDATIFTGIFQPKDHASIWLFITEEKTSDRTDYADYFDGEVLDFEGQKTGRTDDKIINHVVDGNEILVFYRKKKDQYPRYAFRYLGRFMYVTHKGNKPKEFILQSLDLCVADDGECLGVKEEVTAYEYTEGRSRTRIQTYYERNPRLRAEALRRHGTQCAACGFDFSDMYGRHGEGYIEIHHLRPVSSYAGDVTVNPETDLIPLCSNCHRMIHRKGEVLTLDDLRNIIRRSRDGGMEKSKP